MFIKNKNANDRLKNSKIRLQVQHLNHSVKVPTTYDSIWRRVERYLQDLNLCGHCPLHSSNTCASKLMAEKRRTSHINDRA